MSSTESLLDDQKYQVLLMTCPASMPLSFAAHPWFVVNKKGDVSRWEVTWRPTKRPMSESWSHIRRNMLPPFYGLRAFRMFEGFRWKGKVLGMVEGDKAVRMIECIESSPNAYPYMTAYSFTGPNSNTYAQWILDQCPEAGMSLPWNAFGRSWKLKPGTHFTTNDKIVLAHAGFFNKASKKRFRENSAEVCREAVKRDYIGIVEVDVRKTADGVLYCFHGSFFQYHFLLKFPRTLSWLKARYGVDTLESILEVIPKEKSVFLDIKDRSVTREDVLRAFEGRTFKEVMLGNKSVAYLKRFHSMPSQFAKILNGNILCNFYDLRKLKRDNFKYLEVVFAFQISNRAISWVESHGLEFRCSGLFFLSSRSYWKIINYYGLQHVSSDFI